MSEEKVSMDPRKQALLRLGIMHETPLETIVRVFTAKNASYKESWCKRGKLAFVASMARKVDRLEKVKADTESMFDTKLDLVAYLALYNIMLERGKGLQESTVSTVERFVYWLQKVDDSFDNFDVSFNSVLINRIKFNYDVFLRASAASEVRAHPERYGVTLTARHDISAFISESTVNDLEELAYSYSQETLKMAWVLYYREHNNIKTLCK